MQLTSLLFFGFLLVSLFSFYLAPKKFRNYILLISSILFYLSFGIKHLAIVMLITLIGYAFSFLAYKKKQYSYLGISLLVLSLFYFKYYLFFTELVMDFARLPVFEILLPLGISFYTFQIIGNLLDISRGKAKPEKNILIYSLSILFFPKAVSGPIERTGFASQFQHNNNLEQENIRSGLTLMLIGYFKKIVIADRLAVVVNQVFGNLPLYTGIPLILAGIFYLFQLYCDFSGYTDIARGISKLFGKELTINFKRPFLSKNVSEFWRRWHISLSTWFQDYMFNPLYLWLSKKIKINQSINHIINFTIAILIVETLLGIWHGANLTFAFFGLYFGILISLYYISRKYYDRLTSAIQIGINFLALVIGMIIFRSGSLAEASYIFSNITDITLLIQGIHLNVSWAGLIINILLIAGLLTYEILVEFFGFDFSKLSEPARLICYSILLVMIAVFGAFNQVNFLYSQF